MSSRERFEAWFAAYHQIEPSKGAEYLARAAWQARDPEVARLVEALRRALPASGYANYHGALSDQTLESLRALLREYEETRDE